MRIVLRLGGSVIASPVNIDLMNRYAEVVLSLINQNHELVVIVGGGTLAREFIGIAKKLKLEEKDLTYEAGGNIYYDTSKFPGIEDQNSFLNVYLEESMGRKPLCSEIEDLRAEVKRLLPRKSKMSSTLYRAFVKWQWWVYPIRYWVKP